MHYSRTAVSVDEAKAVIDSYQTKSTTSTRDSLLRCCQPSTAADTTNTTQYRLHDRHQAKRKTARRSADEEDNSIIVRHGKSSAALKVTHPLALDLGLLGVRRAEAVLRHVLTATTTTHQLLHARK